MKSAAHQGDIGVALVPAATPQRNIYRMDVDNVSQIATIAPVQTVARSLARIVNINATGSLSRGWPRLWDRFTFTDRTPTDTLAEGIDNPTQEMSHFGPITVEISIGGEWLKGALNLETAWMRIRDNGPGIELDRLEKCLALGELAHDKPTGLHEHGVGMKTMLLTFCRSVESLKYIATRTVGAAHGYTCAYFDHDDPTRPFGEIAVRYNDDIFKPGQHGTELYIVGLSDKGVYKRRQEYTKYVIDQLGFKYARLLSGDTFHGHKLSLRFRLCDQDGAPLHDKNGAACDWDIAPVVQRYRNAERPTIDQEKITGVGPNGVPYYAVLTFGRTAQSEEYKSAGIAELPTYHPCHQYNRRIHVVMHGKVLTSLDISHFGGDPNSNTYVPYTGVLTLVNGFATTYEKNGIDNDGNWQQLCERVYTRIQPLITKWAQERPNDERAKKQREKQIRDAYVERLREPIPGSDKTPAAEPEYPVEGSGGKVDIWYREDKTDDNGFVIEIKADIADGNDVWQTYGYVFMSPNAKKDRCCLIADAFSTGAKETARKIEKELGVRVELRTLEELNLDQVWR